MGKHWSRGFHFTKNERLGIQIMAAAVLFLFIMPTIVHYFTPRETKDYSELQAKLANFDSEEQQQTLPTSELFAFDPNTASFEDFTALGLSKLLANRILNYREKGGTFRKPDDFAKMYGLSTEQFERLLPYITIERAERKWADADANHSNRPKSVRKVELQKFDPNTATFEEFCALGLSEKTAKSVIKYRNKGGVFRVRSDFEKIYALEDGDYERLAPYITLPEKQFAEHEQPKQWSKGPQTYGQSEPSPKQAKSANVIIDINTATEEDWQQLRGIGPYFSKKIVQFREKLGGFASIEQVGETYGLPDSTFQNVKAWLELSPIVVKLNINEADEAQLAGHPYISKKESKLIVAYRNQHGQFNALDNLLNIKVLDAAWLEKVRPYLAIE